MKYLFLPISLLKFWYLEGLTTFFRIWKNLISYLEEDLAVGLMLKLLFVPLFHDSSIIGFILSFIFRITRIFIGLFAFLVASIGLITLALFWFSLPALALLGIGGLYSKLLFLSGMGLFIIHTFLHPHKKIWQVKTDNLWESSKIKKGKFSYHNLLQTQEVELLLSYLETNESEFRKTSVPDLDAVGLKAFELAKKTDSIYIEPEVFFVSILELTPNIENILLKLNLDIEDFEGALAYLQKRRSSWRRVWIWEEDFTVHHLRGTNRGWLGMPTPVLDSVSEDLTRTAAKGEFNTFFGRTSILSQVIDVLSQQKHRNVILVGSAGSGKSTLIKSLAKQIVTGNAPSSLATKRLVELDLTKLLSGVKTQGDLAQKVKDVFEQVQDYQNIIVVMEEIHNIVLGEAGSEFNLHSLITPYLDFGNFQFIATTEPENFNKILEKTAVFARVFTKIEIPSASTKESLDILEGKAIELERNYKIRVSFIALKRAVELSNKFIHDRVLPDSAMSILDQAIVKVNDGWVNSKSIEDIVSEHINVPIVALNLAQKEELLNLESEIKQTFIGQIEAVKKVADTLRRGAVSLREGSKPIGSFLFVGPTGVGKTQLAKVLANTYFKSSNCFLRFDMSQYQTTQAIDMLIGKSGESGQLTEQIKNKPYALILLDEFEKADPKILNLFLQVLDDGRLTNGEGQVVDFSNTIIIATSNAASQVIAKGLEEGKPLSELENIMHQELLTVFKPELLNRFDEVVLFKPLDKNQLKEIVKLKLNDLQKLLKDQGYIVEFDEGVIEMLAEKGYDLVLGARPLNRLIQDSLEARLSRMILEGKLPKGEMFKANLELLA